MKNPPLYGVLPALICMGFALGIVGCRQQPGAGADTESCCAPKCSGNFILRSSAITNGGMLPVEFTGDGDGSTPPLEWAGAPPETKSYAIIMSHVDPQGLIKWYWTLYNIPPNVRTLPKNTRGIGTLGNNSVNRQAGYAPPHSKGPGPKTYILTVYALSGPVEISAPPAEANRSMLLAAMKNLVLDSAELTFTFDRTAVIEHERAK